MNLKHVLMELGNRLVTDRRFNPGISENESGPSTFPIVQFTKWLNDTPAAQEVLADMGVRWPMPRTKD